MTTAIAFSGYDNMIITNENGEVNNLSFVNNMGILINALEQTTPEQFKNISDAYENELDEASDSRMANYAYCSYKQNIKELLQKNWNKVRAIVENSLS